MMYWLFGGFLVVVAAEFLAKAAVPGRGFKIVVRTVRIDREGYFAGVFPV